MIRVKYELLADGYLGGAGYFAFVAAAIDKAKLTATAGNGQDAAELVAYGAAFHIDENRTLRNTVAGELLGPSVIGAVKPL